MCPKVSVLLPYVEIFNHVRVVRLFEQRLQKSDQQQDIRDVFPPLRCVYCNDKFGRDGAKFVVAIFVFYIHVYFRAKDSTKIYYFHILSPEVYEGRLGVSRDWA